MFVQAIKPVGVITLFCVIAGFMHMVDGEAQPSPVEVKHQPNLSVITVQPESYQLNIKSWGEIVPFEQTLLSSQVSGRVTFIAPSFEVGGLVRKGELLFSIEVADFESKVVSAEAELALQQAKLSEEIALADVAKEQWREISNVPTELALRKPQLAAARANVKAAKGQLTVAQRELARTKVFAPFDAVVINRELGVGQVISAGNTVSLLYNAEQAKVIAPVASFDLPFLPKGEVTDVKAYFTSGVNRQQGEYFPAVLKGRLGFIENQTRMSQLLIAIDDPYRLKRTNAKTDFSPTDFSPTDFSTAGLLTNYQTLPFGSYVELEIPALLLDDVFRLPQHLVSNQRVWVVNQKQQLVSRQVEIVREDDYFVYARGGILADDKVVVELPDFVKEGVTVNVVEDANADKATQL